jgi:hypothetical protein
MVLKDVNSGLSPSRVTSKGGLEDQRARTRRHLENLAVFEPREAHGVKTDALWRR